MAFSNTISATTFNTRKVIDRALGRCRIQAAMITSEHIDIAKDELYLLLSEWANEGIPLWCLETLIMPLYEGVGEIILPVGVVDVTSANLRQEAILEGLVTMSPTEHETDFGQPIEVATVGIKWAGPSVPLVFERSDDGLVWAPVAVKTSNLTQTPATAGQWSWFDLASVVASDLFLVRATTGTLAFEQLVLCNMPNEIPIARLNRDEWNTMPNKTAKGRPLQYWFDRQVRQPVMHLWQVPNAAFELQQVVLQVHRHIMDVGTLQQEIEVPQRWYNALVAVLASRAAMAIAEVDPGLVPVLAGSAKEALYLAQQEERDASPINWAPLIGVYTR